MKIFNGSKHMVRFFSMDGANSGLVTKQRHGSFYALDYLTPAFEIPRMIPLEAPEDVKAEDGLFSFFQDYEAYDLIICSRKYAEYAKEKYGNQHPEYVDRLCVLIPLFQDEHCEKKIGCIGFRKAFPSIWSPSGYYERIRDDGNSGVISLFAAQEAFIEKSESAGLNFIEQLRFYDLKMLMWKRNLIDFLSGFSIQNRNYYCAYR